MRLRKHYIHTTTKNAAVALNMAQQVWDKENMPVDRGVQELVTIINTASLSLQRVCEAMQYEFNMENDDD
jgi:hypothetical protein